MKQMLWTVAAAAILFVLVYAIANRRVPVPSSNDEKVE